MPTLRTVNPKDLEFILKLDKKVHYTTPVESIVYGKGIVDHFTDVKLRASELNELIKILERSDYVFHPVNTAMGFSVGFQVTNTFQGNQESLLLFIESQLPGNYNFEILSRYFMESKNLERAGKAGIEIINNRDKYVY